MSEGVQDSNGGGSVLMVTSSGGHAEELMLLRPVLGLEEATQVWVTTQTAHTAHLLRHETVIWVPPVSAGQFGRAMAGLPRALSIHRALRPRLVASAGAALAAPHLLAAAAYACPFLYVESATRVHGPSRTGRLAQRLRGGRLLTQGTGWGDQGWQAIDGVFDLFELEVSTASHELRRAVVTLGTERFPFPRAVAEASAVLDGCDVRWQVGSTPSSQRSWVPRETLIADCAAADVVITHGGVGSILMCWSVGKVPVVIPRRRTLGEHVDDHQLELAELLDQRGLIVLAEPGPLRRGHLIEAASRRVRPIDR